jgi:hypothetical protein
MTIPDTTARLITKLGKSVANVRTATKDDARLAARGFMSKRASELCDRRDVLLEKIELGWDWLEAYEDGDPEAEPYVDKFAAWNEELRAITDALDAAAMDWMQPMERRAA